VFTVQQIAIMTSANFLEDHLPTVVSIFAYFAMLLFIAVALVA